MADKGSQKIIKLLRQNAIISLIPSKAYFNKIARLDHPARIHISRLIEPITIPSFLKSSIKTMMIELQNSEFVGEFLDAECKQKHLEHGCKVLNSLTAGAFNDFIRAAERVWEEYNGAEVKVFPEEEIKVDPLLVIQAQNRSVKKTKPRMQKAKISIDAAIRQILNINVKKGAICFKRYPAIKWKIIDDVPFYDDTMNQCKLQITFYVFCCVDGSNQFNEIPEEYDINTTVRLDEVI